MRAHPGPFAGAAAAANAGRCVLVLSAITAFAFARPLAAAAAALPPEVSELLPQAGADVGAAGGWQLGDILAWLWGVAAKSTAQPLRLAVQAVLYLLLASFASLVCTSAGWRRCLDAVSVLGFGAMSLAGMMDLVGGVGAAAQQSQTYLAAFVPVFSGVLALGGQTAGAAGYGGLFFAVSSFLSVAIDRLLLPVMRIYFCFAVSAALWGDGGIEEAANLFSRCLGALLKGCGAVFGFVLGLQNVFTGIADTAAVRMGGSVLAGAIPIVGDAAAAALSSAAAAVHLLKGSLALALIGSMGAVFAPLFLHCLLYYLAFSAAGIVAGGCGQGQCGRICRLFAEGAKLCASILVLYFFMVFLSTALLLMTGNGG